MNFILCDKILNKGQSLLEYILTFTVIAVLTVFSGSFFRAIHTTGGGGSLDKHHETAMNLIVGNEIPPITDFYPKLTGNSSDK